MFQILLGGLLALFAAYFITHVHKPGFEYFGIHEHEINVVKVLVVVSIAFIIICIIYLFLRR